MRTTTRLRLRRDVALRAGCSSEIEYVDTQCAYCGILIAVFWTAAEPRFILFDGSSAHLDHVIPESRNGATSLDNTVLACATCNVHKHDRAFGDPAFLTWLAERRAAVVAERAAVHAAALAFVS